MRTIYLSPHLDDAVISAGGLIRAQADAGMQVAIWTFMAGYPSDADLPEFAQLMHRIWGFSSGTETVRARRAEDVRAAAVVGAETVHFDFLDCIYRRGRQGEALYSDITVPIQPDDSDLPDQIARAITARLQPDDIVVCQLGVGKHVDHVIVRQAAELLRRPVVYIADIPYALNYPAQLEAAVVGLEHKREPVSEAHFKCWIEAIECYASQVDSAFGSHEDMHERMREFWQQGGVGLWTLPAHG